MPLFGNIIVIKRNGTDGISFPLTASSCLFGRRSECDIRIRLPQVSKEHCKIEVNENKEAILTNLSTVNPTQLNGSCFQQPVPLKHGDVLTIIDRSFRFEYPLQSTPRKRRSRSPKDETLQVLHVQQVAEVELLHKQTSGSKSLHASDNAECEEKNSNENKQSAEENIFKTLSVKLQTPKSSLRMHQSVRKQVEMSPFSKLYEKLKHEIQVKKPLQEGNVSQQAAKEDGKSEPGALFSSSSFYDLGSLTKEEEMGGGGKMERCQITIREEEISQISVMGSATKSFTRSPRTPVSKEMSRDIGKRSHLQVCEDSSTAVRSKATEVTAKPRKENDGNAALPREQCLIERLGYADRMQRHSLATPVDKLPQTTNATSVSEVDKCVLSTPTPRRKSPRSRFITPVEETNGMNSLNTSTPRRRVSLKRKSLSEIAVETQSSKQHTPGKPVEEALQEICDQANFVNSEDGCSETPSSSSNSKSPKRKNRQSKESSHKSVHSETLASAELTSELASPAGQKPGSGRKRGRPRSSGLLSEKALEASAVQEHHDKTTDRNESEAEEELGVKTCHQEQDLADVTRPRRLSSKRRSSGSAAVLEDDEAVSEMNNSDLLAVDKSGKTKRVSQKRRSDELILQPSGKRKRVSFGGHLSPELFDKSLPPNSPLKKGAIPARLSLPFGNSPRAVLKKTQGLKHFAVQTEKTSPKKLLAQKSPTASPPAFGKASPKLPFGSPAPYTKGRFSVSRVLAPLPIAEETGAVAEEVNTKERNGAQVKTPKSRVNRDDKTFSTATPDKSTRSTQLGHKVTPMRRRSGTVAVFNAKRRSGASSANLLVAKSWADVVKLGVARPQSKTVKKSVRKGRSLKKITQSPKTPERKVKGHFSTGHAESPATIVVGRAYSTTVRTSGRVPKVVKNPVLKLNMNMDESFTGITEMFQTPENKSGKSSLASVQKTDSTPSCVATEISELHTPEETGEMMVSPLNNSDASEQRQDSPGICHFLREESLKSVFDAISTETPAKRIPMLEENITVSSLSSIPEKQVSGVKSGSKRKAPKQKLEPAEDLSGIKQLMKTPKQKSEPVEDLSGIKQLMKTPKQKSEPVEDLSGIKQLLKTPKQKLEPVQDLSGIKQLMKTPKRKSEPVEALSGIKQLMKTPKRKSEPVEDLSGIKCLMKTPKRKLEPVETLSSIKQLMKTPKQKSEPVEALSGIKQLMKTPKRKSEPVEDLSGIKQLMKTPKQKSEPVEALSGIKQLMKTPKQKSEPVEALSGIKQLLRTPEQKSEPAEVVSSIECLMRTPQRKPEPLEVLSGIRRLMRTPQQKPEPVEVFSGIKELMQTPQRESKPVTDEIAFEKLLKAPTQKSEAVKDVAGVTSIKKTPKLKSQPVEDLIGLSRIFKTPKEKAEPVEDTFGISRLVKTPKEKCQPVDDFVGLQRLMAEPRQKRSDSEVDYVGVTEMFGVPEEIKVKSINVMDSKQENNPSTNSSHKSEDQPTQRPKRGRPGKTAHPASAKWCEKELNLKQSQNLEKKSTQEEEGEIDTSTSVAKNKGRGRRANCHIQEEIVSQQTDQDKVEVDAFVEAHGATQRQARGKRKELKELKPASENLESCDKDSSVLQKDPASIRQVSQAHGINDVTETEGDPTVKAVSVPSSVPNESCQLQTDVKKPEKESNEGGIENGKEMLLSPGPRRVKKRENPEPLILPKRGRRAKNDQVKETSTEDLHGTTRRLCKGSSSKVMQREQTSDRDTETATAEKNRPKLETKVTEERVKSLRSARRRSAEGKDICGMALEDTQNIQKAQEASTETQSHLKKEVKVSQGDETKSAQENTTEPSHTLKAKSSSGEKTEMPVTALNLEATRSAVQETNRTRSRRGRKESLEKKHEELAKESNNLELITPEFKSETEVGEFSLKDSLSSVCISNTDQVTKDQNAAATSRTAANGDSLARNCQKRPRSGQEIVKPKPGEILQENQGQRDGTTCRRGRGRKVNFDLEEVGSKEVGGKRSLPGDDKGMTYKDGPCETSEIPSPQVRRSRRKQVNSVPQVACSTFMQKQTLIADHSKDEAFVKEQDSASEATPSSAEDNPSRRGKRQEVAAASQRSRSLSVRKRRGLLEGDDEKMTVREDQNPALGNKTLQAKANASARDKRRKIDLAAEAKSSASLQRTCGLSETDDKEEGTNEEQNTPLETVSCAKEKPLGRGRKKETALASHTSNCVSLRGRRGLPAEHGGEEAPKKDQNVPLESLDSSVKENQQRKGRKKEIALLLEDTTSIRGKRSSSEKSGGKNNCREAKKLILENCASREKTDLSKGTSGQVITLLAVSSTSLQGLPQGGKNEAPEEQQSMVLEVALSAKENTSRVGRKRNVASKSEDNSSTCLGEKPTLPKGRGQKRILKEGKDTSLENNSSQGNTRQLRSKREKVEFTSEAAGSTSVLKNSNLPENGNASEPQNVCSTSPGSEKNNLSGNKGKELNPVQEATSTSHRRRCQVPADDLASKKFKSENDENGSLQRGRRNKTKEELGKEDSRAARTARGTDKKTRSSTRTRK